MLLKENNWLDDCTLPCPSGVREYSLQFFANDNDDIDVFMRSDNTTKDVELTRWHQEALCRDQKHLAKKWESLCKALAMHYKYNERKKNNRNYCF